jgi:hypothetical protein
MVRLRNGGLLRVMCPSCARYAYRVGSYWLCRNLDCKRLVVDVDA